MLGLEALLQEYKEILKDYYPNVNGFWEIDDENLLGDPTSMGRKKAEDRLKNLLEKTLSMGGREIMKEESELLMLLKDALVVKIVEIGLKEESTGEYLWTLLPSLGGSVYSAIGHLDDNLQSALRDNSMTTEQKETMLSKIGEKFLKYLKAIPDYADGALEAKVFVKGWEEYDRGNVKMVLGKGKFSIDDIYYKLESAGAIPADRRSQFMHAIKNAKRGLNRYHRGLASKKTISTWVIGKEALQTLYNAYGTDGTIDDLVNNAKEDIRKKSDEINSFIEAKYPGSKDIFDAMKNVMDEKIIEKKSRGWENRMLGFYESKGTEVINKLKKKMQLPPNIDFEFKLLPKEARDTSPGVFTWSNYRWENKRLKCYIYINPEDETINFKAGVVNTILHEIFGHIVHQYYDMKKKDKNTWFALFTGDLDTNEGLAVYMERFGYELDLTDNERLYQMFEYMKPSARLLEEIAVLTGNLSVLEGVPGIRIPRPGKMSRLDQAYLTAVKLNQKYRLLSFGAAKRDLYSYQKYPDLIGTSYGYGGSYGRGKFAFEAALGDYDLSGAISLLKKGTLHLNHILN